MAIFGIIGSLLAAGGFLLVVCTVLAILSDPPFFWNTFRDVFLNWKSIFFYIFTLPIGMQMFIGFLYFLTDLSVVRNRNREKDV